MVEVPALFCVLISFSYKICGISLSSAQLTSIFFSALLSPLAFFMGKTFYNEKVGIISGIFTATSVLIWEYSARVLSEPELTFFINLSILFLYFTLKKGTKKYAFLLGVFLGLSFWFKELAAFFVPVVVLILIEKKFDVKTRIRNFFICGITGAGVIAPWYYYVYSATQKVQGDITERRVVQAVSTTWWGVRSLQEMISMATFLRTLSVLVLILFYIGVIAAVHRYSKQKHLSDKLLVVTIGVWFTLFVFNTFMSISVRRFIPMLLPLYILSSKGLMDFYNRMKKVEVAVEKTKPALFIFIIFLFSFWNLRIGHYGTFNYFSLVQENPLDDPLEIQFREDCQYFSTQYPTDEVVGSLLAHMFYFYTGGAYETRWLGREELSQIASKDILCQMSPNFGVSKKGLLEQILNEDITVLVLFSSQKAIPLIGYLRSHPDIFTETTNTEYKVTVVFEINKEELEEYFASLA
jgi:hypothetical protein